MAPALALYNQSTGSDDDFIANFVARHDVLETLCRRLRSANEHTGDVHHILIGPRGMGKTSMLRRLAIAINRDAKLASLYIPLSFREEQYNVLHLRNFWQNCTEALAEWAERTGKQELADRIDQLIESNVWNDDEKAAEQFRHEMAVLRRRAVLLIDNMDLILDALPDDDQWSLRRYLQHKDGPIVIGAATQALKEAADRKAAFYEFFQPHYLEPLAIDETMACIRQLAVARSAHGRRVLDVIQRQPERLKTLHTLTGGNPRVLVLIYRLLETAETEAVMADLESLLDQVTPYYKARIEEYQTPQQRAVIDAIALFWDPISIGELSRVTDIKTTTLSGLLTKLRKDGLIENTETSGPYAGYQIVERFLNIWYLMRHGTRRTKQKMRWLVGFLTSFYSRRELRDLAERLQTAARARHVHPDYQYAFQSALSYPAFDDSRSASGLGSEADGHFSGSAQIDGTGFVSDKIRSAFDRARSAFELGDFTESLKELSGIVEEAEKHDGADAAIAVARALVNKGVTLGQQGDSSAEIKVYDSVVARFGDDQTPALREQVARALVNKGYRLGQQGDSSAAIEVYDTVVARFGDDQTPALREGVARALVNKGYRLGEQGDSSAAIEVYDSVVARFGDDETPALREQVAMALVNKGYRLGQQDDSSAEIEFYEQALQYVDGKDRPSATGTFALLMIQLANKLLDTRDETSRAETLYLQASEKSPLVAKSNLAWLYLLENRKSEAAALISSLDELPEYGMMLLNSAQELCNDNFGSATAHLSAVLDGVLDTGDMSFEDDLERLLRLAERTGYDERLLKWFDETGYADKVAPLYAAFKAYVLGERHLLDVNPEVRQPAELIYKRLTAIRRYKEGLDTTKPKKRGQGARRRK